MGSPTVITFYGPNAESQIKAMNANGFEVARFMVSGNRKDFSISRLTSPNTPPVSICTATTSSLSASTKIQVHGMEFKLKEEFEIKLETPQGTMRWKQESIFSSREMKLLDGSGRVVARATTKDDVKMEILVQGDEIFLDSMLAGWVAFIYKMLKVREINKAGAEVVGALAGG
jgi:hypothetical protein